MAGGARGAAPPTAPAPAQPGPARAARRAADRLRVHRRRARREGPEPPRAPPAGARGGPRLALRRPARGRGAGASAGAARRRSGSGAGGVGGRARRRDRRAGRLRLAGSTLYVTTAEGNTVKVTTSPGTTVTKTVKASVKGIHPGETVTVTGAAGANGAISAESISVGARRGRRPRRRCSAARAQAPARGGRQRRGSGGRRRRTGRCSARAASDAVGAHRADVARRSSDTIIDKGAPCLTSTATDASPRQRPRSCLAARLPRAGGLRRLLEQLRPRARHATAATTRLGQPRAARQGPRGGRFTALRECLQKNGITLPKRTPGQRRPAPAASSAAARRPAAAQGRDARAVRSGDQEVRRRRRFAGAGGGRLNSPAFKQALAKFAACMRENGVNVPAPNTSGKGPIFNTKGLNTTSPQFKAAETKCSARPARRVRAASRAGPARPAASAG